MKYLYKILTMFLFVILLVSPQIGFCDDSSDSHQGPTDELSEASQEYLSEQGDSPTEESEDADNAQERQQQVEEKIEQAISAVTSGT